MDCRAPKKQILTRQGLKMNRKRFWWVAGDSDRSQANLEIKWMKLEKLWALDLCICLKRAGDWIFEPGRLFCESQIFLKSFAQWIFEMARNLSPHDLHSAAKGSEIPIFLKRANKSWRESRSCTCRGGEVETSANDLPSKARFFTSLDEVPFGC